MIKTDGLLVRLTNQNQVSQLKLLNLTANLQQDKKSMKVDASLDEL